MLITDHNVRETLDIVDRAYILHDGQVLMEGLPAKSFAVNACARFISATGLVLRADRPRRWRFLNVSI